MQHCSSRDTGNSAWMCARQRECCVSDQARGPHRETQWHRRNSRRRIIRALIDGTNRSPASM
eukprot:11201103-Alexandrium_andersonii.AAC.1